MELEEIARNLNLLGSFCGKRDLQSLTQEEMERVCGQRRADCMILFGGSIPCGGDVAAQAYQYDLAKYFLIAGGEGHTTESLRQKFHQAFWDMEVTGKMEADIYAEYLYRQYGIMPDWLERDSTNCSSNAANAFTILRQQQIFPRTLLVIHDATMQLRVEATLRQYVGDNVQIINYASYQAEVKVHNGELIFSPGDIWGMWTMDQYITLLLGEIERLRDDENGYGPAGKNYIVHVEIPAEIEAAYQSLRTVYGSSTERLAANRAQ